MLSLAADPQHRGSTELPMPSTAAGHQLCSQRRESTYTSCTQSWLQPQLHLGLSFDFTKHEMCFTWGTQPQKHNHVSCTQPFCSSPASHCFLIALQVGSSSVCFHPAFIDLSSGFPHQFLASYVRDTPLPVKQIPHGSKDRLRGKSAFCSLSSPTLERSVWQVSDQLSWTPELLLLPIDTTWKNINVKGSDC